jgi:hypothetical protein
LLVFFVYVALLSARGAWGAAHIAYYALLARVHRDREAIERRKAAALGPPDPHPLSVALNLIVEKEGLPCQPFELPIADRAGPMGALKIDGAKVTYLEARSGASNDVFAFFAQQVNEILHDRGEQAELDVVEWKEINDEATEQYLGLVQFARNLERHLGAKELWPKLILNDSDRNELERRLSAICAALRSEAFLPDWEYEGEHKVPVIPEPLGLVSLARTEKRVDPIASMGCALIVVLALVLVLALFVAFPPWVPGT